MKILSWNIQSGLGCDNVRSVARIAQHIKGFDDLAIICLQEVARYFPEYTTAAEQDQLEALTNTFDDYTPVWGAGMHWHSGPGRKAMEFGNLTLVSKGLCDWRVHSLPRPPGAGKKQLPRCAVETVIRGPGILFTLFNTHIAYHNEEEQSLQLAYLRQLQTWHSENKWMPVLPGAGAYSDLYRSVAAVICGDLNITPESSLYDEMVAGEWRDLFKILHPEQNHGATCGVYDRENWKEGPHCRDFFLATNQMIPYVSRIEVDTICNYSDHQPIILSLDMEDRGLLQV